jgi:hypothetical protein
MQSTNPQVSTEADVQEQNQTRQLQAKISGIRVFFTRRCASPSQQEATHCADELLACCQCVLLGVLGLGAGQGVEVKAQGAHLAAQLLTGLSPAGGGGTRRMDTS